MIVGEPFDVLDDVTVGDDVTIYNGSRIDYPSGGVGGSGFYGPPDTASPEARVIGIDIEMLNLMPRVTLHCSQETLRVFLSVTNLLDVTSANAASKDTEMKQNSTEEKSGPISYYPIAGSIIPDPDYSFPALSFQPSIGSEDYPWKFAFVDNGVYSTDDSLIIASTSASASTVSIRWSYSLSRY
jgi:hypothetical protein